MITLKELSFCCTIPCINTLSNGYGIQSFKSHFNNSLTTFIQFKQFSNMTYKWCQWCWASGFRSWRPQPPCHPGQHEVSTIIWFNTSLNRGYRGHDRMVVGFTTTCGISALSPLKLWVQTQFMARCTWYNIMWWSLPVTCDRWFPPPIKLTATI